MQKQFTGYCPTQNKDYTIYVTYIDTSDTEQSSYTKGIATCNYTKFGGVCDSSKCPLIKSAPENL